MFSEHLPGFFTDFGETVTFVSGTSTTVGTAIFDNRYVEALDAAGQLPYLTMIEADTIGLRLGDSASVRGVSYSIRGFEPDGSGITAIRLEKA